MKLSRLIDVWGVPLMIAVVAFLFWFHTLAAPAVATRVPHAVIFLIIALLIIVMRSAIKKQRAQHTSHNPLDPHMASVTTDYTTGKASSVFHENLRTWAVQIFFVLGVLYFLSFDTLGFSISNFLYVCLTMALVKNYQADLSAKDVFPVLLTAILTTGCLFLFVKLTSFNIPTGIFGI